MAIILALQIHVDTERGTRVGVLDLAKLLREFSIPATFYFSLGPDNTGRALQRIFRPGFFRKVSRTSVVSTYGIPTLLNGVLWPGPHIGKRHGKILRNVKDQGFEVGIHTYDHQKWQDNINRMSPEQIAEQLQKAFAEFTRIFGEKAKSCAAPGWQTNAEVLSLIDQAQLLYNSDCRGRNPFYPKMGEKVFKTLQIPTTLPTLDELLGRPEYPLDKIAGHYIYLLKTQAPNVLTIHAELEGMKYLTWFREFLSLLKDRKVEFKFMGEIADLFGKDAPIGEMVSGEVDGRSGVVMLQGSLLR